MTRSVPTLSLCRAILSDSMLPCYTYSYKHTVYWIPFLRCIRPFDLHLKQDSMHLVHHEQKLWAIGSGVESSDSPREICER